MHTQRNPAGCSTRHVQHAFPSKYYMEIMLDWHLSTVGGASLMPSRMFWRTLGLLALMNSVEMAEYLPLHGPSRAFSLLCAYVWVRTVNKQWSDVWRGCFVAASPRTSRWLWCVRGGTCGWLVPSSYPCVFTLSSSKSPSSLYVHVILDVVSDLWVRCIQPKVCNFKGGKLAPWYIIPVKDDTVAENWDKN